MLKQTITYEDWDDQTVTEDLYFNITKAEVGENLSLLVRWKDDFEAFQKSFEGRDPDGEVPPEDVETMLKMVKAFMELSYGRRPDQKRFEKGPEVWKEFTQTAAYSHFLMSLFSDIQKAFEFMSQIFPAEFIREAQVKNPEAFQALESAATSTDADVLPHRRADAPQPADRQQRRNKIAEAETVTTVLDETAPWWTERQPTLNELREMNPEEFKRYQAWFDDRQ